MRAGLALDAARGAYGVVLLVRPNLIARPLLGRPLDGSESVVSRVLAARHLLQAGWSVSRPRTTTYELGAVVDVLHASSMIALGLASRRHRRAALGDAVVESAIALTGVLVVREGTP